MFGVRDFSQLLQKEWELKAFVIREFHICKCVSHLLQREMTGSFFLSVTRSCGIKGVCHKRVYSDYKMRRMQDVCHTRSSHLLQGDNGRCLLYGR